LRGLLNVLTVLGVFVGVHSILNVPLGHFLFDTPRHQAYMKQEHYFYFLVNHIYRPPGRASSFLLNPDSDGAFLVMMFFLPAGLFFAARSYLAKALYLAAAIIIAVALLFTYTAAAWVALPVGVVALVGLAVRPRQAVLTLGGIVVLGVVGALALHSEVQRLLHHATGASELSQRVAIWEGALRVIRAFPLTGIGLGTGQPYITRSAPYVIGVSIYGRPHPHDSFLELAAFAGIPVLLVYLAILVRAGLRAVTNYRLASWEYRPVFACALAALVALTVHGFADATWTLPPIVPIAWMLVGAVSSRQVTESLEFARLGAGKVQGVPVRYPSSVSSDEADAQHSAAREASAQQTDAQEASG
jgi:O-antigen ligase